jgi:hypothetical protein
MTDKQKPEQSSQTSGKPAASQLGNSLEETCRQWFGEETWAAMSETDKAKARKLVAGDGQ